MATVKYECEVCEERNIKSRADWLFHLTLNRHHLKAREKLQQLYLESDGNLFVISGFKEHGGSMTSLLDYLANKLSSFRNFVSFKPQGDVYLMICDSREYERFTATPHFINGTRLTFRNYNEITPDEWKVLLNKDKQRPEQDQGQSAGERKRQLQENMSTAASSSCGGSGLKRPKVEQYNPCEPLSDDEDFDIGNGGNSASSSAIPHQSAPTAVVKTESIQLQVGGVGNEQIIAILKAVMISNSAKVVRSTAISTLRNVLRQVLPACELIPIGADFLGFNLEPNGVFEVYLDNSGLLNPSSNYPSMKRVAEDTGTIRNVGFQVLNLLRAAERAGAVKELKSSTDPNSLQFVFMVNLNNGGGQVALRIKLYFAPFDLAQTAMICKHLYFSSKEVSSLVAIILFWCSKRLQTPAISEVCKAPFIIYWLIYFYLIKKNLLPPLVELQKSCSYQILDREMNVAFTYDPALLDYLKIANEGDIIGGNSLELFLDWLDFMVDVLGANGQLPGANERHSLVCPRYGELVDKRMFNVCKEMFPKNPKKKPTKKKYSKQKKTRKIWTENLKRIGFELEEDDDGYGTGNTFARLAKLNLLDSLCIQHPFYISWNMSSNFNAKASKVLYRALGKTREGLKGKLRELQQQSNGHAKINLLEELSRQ